MQGRLGRRDVVLTALSTALAIAVYGVVFGVIAGSSWGAWRAILASAFIYSGSIQFAGAALLSQGAGASVIVSTAVILNARNVFLGSILRRRVPAGILTRLGVAYLMDDESFGIAMASRLPAALVVVGVGLAFFTAWVGGTALGTLIGSSNSLLAGAADAMFPVLFVGLAAVSIEDRIGVARTAAAGIGTLAVAAAFPSAREFIPVVAAVIVSVAGRRR